MAVLLNLLPLIAAVLLYMSGHTSLFVGALIVAAGCFWSWGIMFNHAANAARQRLGYTRGFYEFTQSDLNTVPNWITAVNMVFSLIGFLLLISGGVLLALR